MGGLRTKMQRGAAGARMGTGAPSARRIGGGGEYGGAPVAGSKVTRIPRLKPELLPRGSGHTVNAVPLIGSTR